MKKTFKFSMCALLSGLALLSFMLENLFPPLIIPGARMGISNVFILLAIFMLGKWYAFAVLIIKCVLGSIFAGNPSAMLYSIPSGVISLLIQMLLILKVKNLSLVSISILGAVINITIQNVVFCIIGNALIYMYYLPYLLLVSLLSGLIVGCATLLLVKKLPEKLFDKTNE